MNTYPADETLSTISYKIRDRIIQSDGIAYQPSQIADMLVGHMRQLNHAISYGRRVLQDPFVQKTFTAFMKMHIKPNRQQAINKLNEQIHDALFQFELSVSDNIDPSVVQEATRLAVVEGMKHLERESTRMDTNDMMDWRDSEDE